MIAHIVGIGLNKHLVNLTQNFSPNKYDKRYLFNSLSVLCFRYFSESHKHVLNVRFHPKFPTFFFLREKNSQKLTAVFILFVSFPGVEIIMILKVGLRFKNMGTETYDVDGFQSSTLKISVVDPSLFFRIRIPFSSEFRIRILIRILFD
jgi:hypothetical protein